MISEYAGRTRSTLRVLVRFIWTRSPSGTLGVPKVTRGVTGPDLKTLIHLEGYKRNVWLDFSATIPQKETLKRVCNRS